MTSRPLVLVPVNLLDRAKGRLSSTFTPAQRRELAIITLRTVVEAAHGTGCPVTILSADESLADLELPVTIDPEVPGIRGLSPQLEHWLQAHHALDEVLILHADLPLATSAAIRALIDSASCAPSATAIQSADGGTNAMLLRPAAGMVLAYGPNSFALHRLAAAAAGYAFAEHHSDPLRLDLDTPGDVTRLFATKAGRATVAGRYLRSLSPSPGRHESGEGAVG